MIKKFHEISVNTGQWRECLWCDAEGNEYQKPFDNMPENYKQMYVLWLRLQGFEVPSVLKQYITDSLQIVFEWDLDGDSNL